jgi:hypothetical protein
MVFHVGDSSNEQTCPEIITRTYRVVDACGNFTTCTQLITIRDTTAPVIAEEPADITVECDSVPPQVTLTATDVCSGVVAVVPSSFTTPSGVCPQTYTITRRWTATDICGNSSMREQVLLVRDTQAPLVTCPDPLTIECGSPIPPPSISSVLVSDNCDPNPTVIHVGDISNGLKCPEVITRTYRATDACGNFTTCTQTITVRDTTPPFATGTLTTRIVSCDSQIPPPVQPSMSDACDSSLAYSVQTITQLSSTTCGKTRLYRWTVRDDCTNTTIRIQTILIRDRTDPAITCPPAVTLSGDANCEAVLPALTATATDNCGGTPVITQNPPAGTLLGPGTHTVTFTAVDACGNDSTCDVTVTVNCNPPGIQLLKTVYLGHNGGASCPQIESVSGLSGQPVTYCFYVVNNGLVNLSNVVITDPLLNIAPINIGSLAVGQSTMRYVESTISQDLVNIAAVTGVPPSGPPVTDTDPAEVRRDVPAIDIQKTARNGADAPCPGVEEIYSVTGETNTYCFVVTNTGETRLFNVQITDPLLNIPPIFIGQLDIGQSVTRKVNHITQGILTNVASVIGYPKFGAPVTDADPALVYGSGPGMEFNKTVYLGHNGGANCPGAENVMFVSGPTAVTYCFEVRNTGDNVLYQLVINDPILGISNLQVGDLAPRQSVTRFVEVSLNAPVTNIATAAGDPPSGRVIVLADPAVVSQHNPAIDLRFGLMPGHGPASGCSAATNNLVAALGSAVTYCFEIRNTGDTALNNFGLDIPQLGLSISALDYVQGEFPLPPGQSQYYVYRAVVQGTANLTAGTAASAVGANGFQIIGLPNVSDVSGATIQAAAP